MAVLTSRQFGTVKNGFRLYKSKEVDYNISWPSLLLIRIVLAAVQLLEISVSRGP